METALLMGLRLLTSVVLLLGAVSASAQVRFGPFAWAPTAKTIVVISPSGENPGVFIGHDSKEQSVQNLSPTRFLEGEGISVFLKMRPSKSGFSKMIFKNGSSVTIGEGGGFVLRVGDVRIGVAPVMDLSPNSYWSISSTVGAPLIRGMVGLTEMFTLNSNEAVAYLEANQLRGRSKASGLDEYSLSSSGELLLGGKPFRGEIVGVATTINNPCLVPKTPIIISGGEKERTASSADFLFVSVDEDVAQVYFYVEQLFGVIRRTPAAEGGAARCVFSKVEMK